MTLGTCRRIYPAVNLVLAEIIAAMGEHPLGRVGKFVARLDLFLVCMAVNAE